MLGHKALKIIPLLGKFKFKKYLSTSSFKKDHGQKEGGGGGCCNKSN